jgi:succinoglycan biosynthesis protein ExoA
MIGRATVESRVVVVIPVLNEARYIAACLNSLLTQAGDIGATIMVVDGGSTDLTDIIVRDIALTHPGVSLLHNGRKSQSAAMNLVARTAEPEVNTLVRADAHALYPPDFLRLCVAALRTRDATSVVVPMHTAGAHGMQHAIAAVQNSRFGNGGAAHRTSGSSGFVEHGHHAVFNRDFFLRIGGYDENFSHNEDAEHDVRSHQAGGRIWMCREATIEYFPRAALWPLARQYYRHGRGRMQTLLCHRLRPRPRQLATPLILAGGVAGLLAMLWKPWFGLIPLSYVVACVLWASTAAVRERDPWLLAMAPAVMTIHLSWAFGFLRGLVMPRAGAGRHDAGGGGTLLPRNLNITT